MALTGKRTAAAGGADATVTTAAGMATVIDSLLTTAGWTVDYDYFSPAPSAWVASLVGPPFVPSNYSVGDLVTNGGNLYQCITSGTAATSGGPTGESADITDSSVHWRFITSAGGSAKVYKSTGESGNETLWHRVICNTNTTPSINVQNYQYFSPSLKLGFNSHSYAGNATPNFHQFQYTAGNTVNFAMTADKDSYTVFSNDSANNRRCFGGGIMKRLPNVISTFFISNAQVTVGANKTFNFASGNPVAAGYQIGDRVFVLGQEGSAASPFNSNIPSYAAVITALTTSSITIDVAQATTAAGAFIGADPQPYFIWTTTSNSDPNSASVIAFPYVWNNTVTNLWSNAATPGQGYLNIGTMLGLLTQAPAECDPNNRTGRVVIGEYIMASSTNEVAGILPKLYANPRTTDTLWNIARTTKEATPRDYVVVPASTAAPAGQRREMIGPFATSGSATFNSDLYQQDSNTWFEAVPAIVSGDNYQVDRKWGNPAQITVGDPTSSQPGLIGQLMFDDPGDNINAEKFDDVMPQGIMYENTASDRTIEGQGSPLRTGGELYPFDTSQVSAGRKGGSFNGGYN